MNKALETTQVNVWVNDRIFIFWVNYPFKYLIFLFYF